MRYGSRTAYTPASSGYRSFCRAFISFERTVLRLIHTHSHSDNIQPIQLTDHFTIARLLRFVLPSIITMVFTSIYGVVDGFFISNYVGKTAFAAANITWPLLMIFAGVGFLFGTGGSALVAAYLGADRQKKACSLFTEFSLVLFAAALVLTILAEVLLPSAVVFLGADESMLPDCIAYGRFLLLGILPFAFQNFFTPFLVTAGKPGLGLTFTLLAGFTNMFSDALFMGVFGSGVAGAALATTLSAIVGSVLPFLYFLLPNKSSLHFRAFSFDGKSLLKVLSNGSSEMITQLSLALVNVLYNILLMKYLGEDGVAAFGVISYVNCIFTAVFTGYAIGSAPVVSAHCGAGDLAEVKGILKKSILLLSIFGLSMALSASALSPALSALFTGYDEALCVLTTHAFRIFAISFLFMGFNIYTSSFFTALGNGRISFLISFLRTFVLQVLCAVLLPLSFGAEGIWWATALAELICLGISALFLVFNRDSFGFRKPEKERTRFHGDLPSEES